MAEPTPFRAYLPDLNTPRFTEMAKQDAHEYARCFIEGGRPPWVHALYQHWQKLLAEPYKGITSDGHVRGDLFRLQDEEVDMDGIAAATQALLALLTPAQREAVRFHLDAPEWRQWSNPEFLLFDKGLRLDDEPEPVRAAVLAVLQATLSPEGYAKARAAMRINGFLGDLVGGSAVMNEHSYSFALFGAPDAVGSTTAPWGFSFYGHHLCLNVFLFRRQMVLSPWFTGAEPNVIDAGPHAGTRILHEEERLGLALMRALPPPLQARAQIYAQMRDPAMPRGRWNHDDQRHLCGAARDNRVVPYEGVRVAEMGPAQVALVDGILEQYLLYLPARARALRLDAVRAHYAETYFSWIGGFGAEDTPFYYRLQSPVVLAEFDHHSGVFLTNAEPKRFHIHTLLRTPNAGDYGMALRPLLPGTVSQDFLWDGERTH